MAAVPCMAALNWRRLQFFIHYYFHSVCVICGTAARSRIIVRGTSGKLNINVVISEMYAMTR